MTMPTSDYCYVCCSIPCRCLWGQRCGTCYQSPCACTTNWPYTRTTTLKWPPDRQNSLTDDDIKKVAAEVLRLLEERLGPLLELARAIQKANAK